MTADFLSRGGEAGKQIRAFDWASTPLGPIADWPSSLRMAIGLLLVCPLPSALAWSDELIFLYNDAWTALADGEGSLGSAIGEAWPEIRERLEPLLGRVLFQGAGETLTDCFPKSGSRSYDLALSPAFDGDGRSHGVFVTAVEATDRVQKLEDALRVSEERYRTLFTSIDEGVCVCEMVLDAAGRAVDYRFLETNPLFGPMTGLPPEALGKTARELVPDLEERWVETYARVALRGEVFRFEDSSASMGRVFDVFATPVAPHGCFALVFKDITERKQAEEAACLQTAQFETLLNQAPLGVLLMDAELRVRQANPVARRALHGPLGEPVDLHLPDLMRSFYEPEQAQDVVDLFRRTLETGEPYFSPHRTVFRQDKNAFQEYEWRLDRTLLPDSSFGVICYFRDISEELKARHAVTTSEKRFHAIFHQASAGVCEVDPEGRLTLANERFAEMTGYSRAELLQMSMRDLTHPEDFERDDALFRALDAAHPDFLVEKRHVRKDGATVWVNNSVTAVCDEHGAVRSVIVVVFDVTERKRKERTLRFLVDLNTASQALSESEEIMAVTARMLGEHLEVSRCAYAEVEADELHFTVPYDYTNGVASIVGRFSMRQFGAHVVRCMLDYESFILCDVDEDSRLDPEDITTYQQTEIRAAICTPLHKDGKFVACMAIHQDQPRRWLPDEIELMEMVVARCWESIERARTVRSLNNEVLEVKSAQEALREADRRKDEFLAMLAHELRNPLAPIRTAVPLLQAGGAAAPRAARIIERQVTNMARLLDDLLDVSRITRGLIRLERERVDFALVAVQAAETARPFIESHGHSFSISSTPDLMIWGDRLRLEQVTVNLLNNAAKYMDPNGSVRLTVSQEGEHAVMRVEDTGIGIPPELLPQVFDLFTQGDRTIDRSQGGLGIGLTMVKSLVELQDGTVEVHSEGLGLGSQFVVRLPLLGSTGDLRSEPELETTESQVAVSALRVLVVDDNRDGAEMLSELLGCWGYETAVANSGAAALSLAEEFRPNVALLDIGMPGMDGYEVARRFRASAALSSVFLVALTGYGSESDRDLARDAGFHRHLVKPVSPAEVKDVLEGFF